MHVLSQNGPQGIVLSGATRAIVGATAKPASIPYRANMTVLGQGIFIATVWPPSWRPKDREEETCSPKPRTSST